MKNLLVCVAVAVALSGCSWVQDAYRPREDINLYRGSLADDPQTGGETVLPLDQITIAAEQLDGNSEVDIIADMQRDVEALTSTMVALAQSRGANAGPLTDAEVALFQIAYNALDKLADKKERFATMTVKLRTYKSSDNARDVALARADALNQALDRVLDTGDRLTLQGALGNAYETTANSGRSAAGIVLGEVDLKELGQLIRDLRALEDEIARGDDADETDGAP